MIDVPFCNLQTLNMRVNTRQQAFVPLLVCRWVFDHGSLLLLLASLKHYNIAWIVRSRICRLSACIFTRAICYWFDVLFSVVYFGLSGDLVWRHSSFAFFFVFFPWKIQRLLDLLFWLLCAFDHNFWFGTGFGANQFNLVFQLLRDLFIRPIL